MAECLQINSPCPWPIIGGPVMSLAGAVSYDWLVCLWPPCQRDNAQLKRNEQKHPSSKPSSIYSETKAPPSTPSTPSLGPYAIIELPGEANDAWGCVHCSEASHFNFWSANILSKRIRLQVSINFFFSLFLLYLILLLPP